MLQFAPYFRAMGVLEIIAEQRLGAKEWAIPSACCARFGKSRSIRPSSPTLSQEEKARVASLVELCFAYERETDFDEKANILRTLEEISGQRAARITHRDSGGVGERVEFR